MEVSSPYDLIAQYLSGNLSEEEQQKLFSWVEQSDENKTLFAEAQRLWALSENYADVPFTTDISKAWKQVESRLETDAPGGKIRRMGWGPQLLRIAAVFIVIALASWWAFENLWQKTGTEVIVQTLANEKRELKLPDGTQIWLNEKSEIRYDNHFSPRKVELNGEAFFDVAHQDNQPFEIHSGDTKTVVLGTAFNVRAYPGEATIEVSVVRGKVALVEEKKPDKVVLLEAGNTGVFDKTSNQLDKQEVVSTNADAWKTKNLSFDNTPMKEVMQSLERYFDVEIDAANPALLNCHFTGNYSQPQLDQILEVLAFGINVEVKQNNSRYLLQGEGCK